MKWQARCLKEKMTAEPEFEPKIVIFEVGTTRTDHTLRSNCERIRGGGGGGGILYICLV